MVNFLEFQNFLLMLLRSSGNRAIRFQLLGGLSRKNLKIAVHYLDMFQFLNLLGILLVLTGDLIIQSLSHRRMLLLHVRKVLPQLLNLLKFWNGHLLFFLELFTKSDILLLRSLSDHFGLILIRVKFQLRISQFFL